MAARKESQAKPVDQGRDATIAMAGSLAVEGDNDEKNAKELPPPIMRLPTEIQAKVLEWCVPREVFILWHRRRPRALAEVAVVCQKFHDVAMDVLSRKSTLCVEIYYRPDDETCELKSCVGGGHRCFQVAERTDKNKEPDGHVPISIFDRFQRVKIYVAPGSRESDDIIQATEAFVDFVKSSCRAKRGAVPLISVEIHFEFDEITFYPDPVKNVLELVKEHVAPFKSLRNLGDVRLSTGLTRGEVVSQYEDTGIRDLDTLFEDHWLFDLRKGESELLKVAKQEMLSSTSS